MIYVFGNSHAHSFTGYPVGTIGVGNTDDGMTSISLGPVIAYNFYIHHFERMLSVLSSFNVDKEIDKILLAIGEVDCRFHLPKQIIEHNRTIDDVVSECTDRFFFSHLRLKSSGYNVIGWGGHPSTTSGHNYSSDSPVYGNCLFRNEITKKWDSLLKQNCGEFGIEYMSIVDELISEDGLTKMEFFNDYCHLNHIKMRKILKEKYNV